MEEKFIISERLLSLKDTHNLTNQEIADAVGVSQPTVSRWLNAENPPQPQHIKKLAKFFGVPLSFMAGHTVAGGHLPPNNLAEALAAVQCARNELDRALKALSLMSLEEEQKDLEHISFQEISSRRRKRKNNEMESGKPPR